MPRNTRTSNLLESLALHAALIVGALITLLPFVYLICTAIKRRTPESAASLFLPRGDGPFGIAWDQLTLNNFARLLTEFDFTRALINSLFLASVTALLATLAAAMGGYVLARSRFRGRTAITSLVITAIAIPGPLLLAPTYQLLYDLRLLDTYAGLILPATAPAFGIFLFRQSTLRSVPPPILEAARIDGASESRIFFSIVLPLVRPMFGAFILITFLATWNNFITPQIVLQTPHKFPLAVALAQLRGLYGNDYPLITAGTIVSIAPVMILFLLLQRDFVTGLTSGAIKQ